MKKSKRSHALEENCSRKSRVVRSREGDKTKKSVGFIDTENRRVNRGAIGADAARTMKRSKAIVNRMETQIGEKKIIEGYRICRAFVNECQKNTS